MSPDFAVIIPTFNEEENIEILYKELVDTLGKEKYEIVFVDDGSSDSTYKKLEAISNKDPKVIVVKLISNYGQSNAIAAGITASTADKIVTMDSDLQHDPKDIVPLIKKLDDGYHVVCGLREKRNESDSVLFKAIPSKFSNFLIRKLSGTTLKDSTGGMRSFTRRVVQTIPYYGEMHRYLPIMAHWKGFKITEIPINIRKRKFGTTKYNYKRLLRGFMDLLTIKFFMKYSTRPFHIFGSIGFFSFAIGAILGLILIYLKLFAGASLIKEIVVVLFAVVLVLLGIMFMGFGFIADMISYDAIATNKRETFIIEKVQKK